MFISYMYRDSRFIRLNTFTPCFSSELSMFSNSDVMKKSNPPERYKIKVSGLPRFYAMAVSERKFV